jgi:outer membrane protein W
MKRVTFAILLLLAAMPLAAQSNMTAAAFYSQTDMQGENEFDDGITTEFDDGQSMGLSVNRMFGSFFSVEASAFNMRSDADLILSDGVTPVGIGNVDLTPIMIGGQWHIIGQRRFDPYLGAGVAYVVANDLNSPDLEASGQGRIEMDSEVTYYYAAGIAVELVGGFAIIGEARQIQYEPTTTSTVTGVEQDLELNPLLYSLGARFRF